MDSELIEGLKIISLKRIEDHRGAVLHMMKNNTDPFVQFGEIYFSLIKANVIKGWKLHSEMTQNFCVPVGQVKFVLYDGRESSKTRGKIVEIELGYANYRLLTIPPGILYSFRSVTDGDSLIANCASIPHRPEESVNIDINSPQIPYEWT